MFKARIRRIFLLQMPARVEKVNKEVMQVIENENRFAIVNAFEQAAAQIENEVWH